MKFEVNLFLAILSYAEIIADFSTYQNFLLRQKFLLRWKIDSEF